LAVGEALAAFSQRAPRQAKVVALRYFGGLTEDEIMAALDICPRTVRRDFEFGKAWLSTGVKGVESYDRGFAP